MTALLLTPQQLAVMADAATGAKLLDTARRLGIAVATVKDQRMKAHRRLGALNTTHAVAILDDGPRWRERLA